MSIKNQIKTAAGTRFVEAKPSIVESILDEYCEARDSRLLNESEIVEANEASYAELSLGLAAG